MAEPALHIEGLVHRYGDKTVLHGVDLSVQPGEIVGYLGPNGAGKSTTMKVLTGQMRPTEGSVRVLGIDAEGVLVVEILILLGRRDARAEEREHAAQSCRHSPS